MNHQPPRAILTDIEGTTSAIAFVKDVLFPYALRELPGFVRGNAGDPAVRHWLDSAALDIGGVVSDECIVELLQDWIREDCKHTALKGLQGMLWRTGYEQGDYRGHVYSDATTRLREWHASGVPVYVYSSGSVDAQKLLFTHSEAGDLSALFSGYFDIEIGGKRDPDSYRNIADALKLAAGDILFLSDIVEELDAARIAGMRTRLVDRRTDYPAARLGADTHGHRRAESFAEIELSSAHDGTVPARSGRSP